MNPLNVLMKGRSAPRWTRFAVAGLMVAAIAGCGGGSDGAAGAPGAPGTPADPTVVNNLTDQIAKLTSSTTNPGEGCVTCHNGSYASNGTSHQAEYAKSTDTSLLHVVIDSVSAVTAPFPGVSTLTIHGDYNGTPLTAADITGTTFAQKKFYATQYDVANKQFYNSFQYSAACATPGANGTILIPSTSGGTTSTPCGTTPAATFDPTGADAQVWVGLAKTKLNTEGSLYDDIAHAMQVGSAVTYVSAANPASCDSCHSGAKGQFLKGGYRPTHLTGTPDFAVCKNCHNDKGSTAAPTAADGGSPNWQSQYDSPNAYAALSAAVNYGKVTLSSADKAKYAYKKSVMNDVHMYHAMSAPYPQSMKNCATCHNGTDANNKDRLARVLAVDDVITNPSGVNQFTASTCRSCHAIDNLLAKMTATVGGASIHSTIATASNLTALAAAGASDTTCARCHYTGGAGPSISAIHNGGYDPLIRNSSGTRYSDVIKATIDTVTYSNYILDIKFSAASSTDLGYSIGNITPTVLVGLYGYNTKDFIVAAHAKAADGKTNLEYAYGTNGVVASPLPTHPRMTPVATGVAGQWEIKVDLSTWKTQIDAKAIKRAEVAVLPTLNSKTETTLDRTGATIPAPLALDAPSKTVDLASKSFVSYFTNIVNVKNDATKTGTTGCNSCHDALGTSFHTADRGGNIVVCRICHEVSNPAAHLEMQSRSIDSYVHAIHSFQPFDVGSMKFTDTTKTSDGLATVGQVATFKYKSHIAEGYPVGTLKNCESCHASGTYDAPSQAKSMPGVLSASATFDGGRNIGTVPSYVAGPGTRACGSCHRAAAINIDDANGLTSQYGHPGTYLIQTSSTTQTSYWSAVVTAIMSLFN